MKKEGTKFEIPFKDEEFHVIGVDGIDIDALLEKGSSSCNFEECGGDVVTMVFDPDEKGQRYKLYWKGASTQGVEVNYVKGNNHIDITLPWLGSVGDVQLAFNLLKTAKEMCPKCEVWINGRMFDVDENRYKMLLYLKYKNMEYLVDWPEKGEKFGAVGINHDFVVPTKWDYPEMSIPDIIAMAMAMFVELQWDYEAYTLAEKVDGEMEGEDETMVGCILDNSDDMLVLTCNCVLLFNNDCFKQIPIGYFIEAMKGSPYMKMVDALQFVISRMPDDDWRRVYDSFETEEVPFENIE